MKQSFLKTNFLKQQFDIYRKITNIVQKISIYPQPVSPVINITLIWYTFVTINDTDTLLTKVNNFLNFYLMFLFLFQDPIQGQRYI